jgi:hypothetical protein
MLTTLHYLHSHWQSIPWQEAPHWAHWAAMDRTGNWFWYEAEPKDEAGYFTATTGRVAQFTHLPCTSHWRMSLQHRPAGSFAFDSCSGLLTYAMNHAHG